MFYLVFFDYPLRELVNAGDQLVIHIHLVSKAENAMYRVNLAIKSPKHGYPRHNYNPLHDYGSLK